MVRHPVHYQPARWRRLQAPVSWLYKTVRTCAACTDGAPCMPHAGAHIRIYMRPARGHARIAYDVRIRGKFTTTAPRGPHSIELVGSVNFLEFVTPKQNSETVVPLLQANCVVPPFSIFDLGSFWNYMTSIGFWFLKSRLKCIPIQF